MLKHTFLHLQGIGEATERRIWRAGIRTWEEFCVHSSEAGICARIRNLAAVGVEESIARFNAGDWTFFDARLPAQQKWRAFGELRERALYVDIETLGLDTQRDCITVVGAFDGERVHSFVAGQNMDEAADLLSAHPLWVTFNGALFDVPMIRRNLAGLRENRVHIDLRFLLKPLGFTGGLKAIERAFGMARPARTQNLDGWDAVRLWREYMDGRDESLDILLEYNAEDVRNLKPLMEFAYSKMIERTGFNANQGCPAAGSGAGGPNP